MKFTYQYRTSDNVVHHGVINGASRDAVFAALKAKGIKPGRVDEAPGFFNKLFGKGKRWIAIFVLSVIAVVFALSYERQTRVSDEQYLIEDRAQLYGDPVVIGECKAAGWTNVFSKAFDCYLARYAVPGVKVPSTIIAPRFEDGELAYSQIAESDLDEVAQMKRMVNGMKKEMSEYLETGGTREGYLKRLDIRQRAERGVFETTQREIMRAKDHSVWKAKNAELRAMGLPMVAVDESDAK